MNKKLGLAAVLLCIGMILFSAKETNAYPVGMQPTVSKRIKLSMVTGETKAIPGLNLRCSAYSEDETIIELDENRDMVAKRAGTGKVMVYENNEYTEVTVTITNTVDVIIAMGQSNMCGAGGNLYASPEPRAGALQYEDGKIRHMEKQGTLLPAFANTYNKNTKVPVVMVHVSVGGSSSGGWLRHGYTQKAAKELSKCIKLLKKSGANIRHVYMLWYQGETDAEQKTPEDVYMDNMRRIYKKMHTVGVEKCLIIQIAEYWNRNHSIAAVVNAQNRLCTEKKDKKKFAMVCRKTSSLSNNEKWYSDVVHMNQSALNVIGKSAGKNAARLAKKKK